MEKNNQGFNAGRFYQFLLIFSLLIIAFIISGCGSGTTQTKYYVGYTGTTIEMMKANPKIVFEEEQFTISMFVRNLGTYTIPESTPGKLTASFDEYYLSIDADSAKPKSIVLHAKNQEYPAGDEEYYEFVFDAKKINNLALKPETTIDFGLCYPYKTEVSLATCIDTKMSSQDERTMACKSTTYTNTMGQGAPLVITKIIPEMLPQKDNIRPQFKIYIENKGKGYVINKDPTKKSVDEVCGAGTSRPDSSDFNKITVKATLSNKELECLPAELKLVDQESYVRCYVKEEDLTEYGRTQKNYVAPLTVTLDYGYYEIQHHEIEIERKQDFFESDVSKEDCGAYQIWDSSKKQCISLCEFCIKNPTDAKCQKNKPTTTFQFNDNFACKCSKIDCDNLKNKGQCILGYCPGTTYCCDVAPMCDFPQSIYNCTQLKTPCKYETTPTLTGTKYAYTCYQNQTNYKIVKYFDTFELCDRAARENSVETEKCN